MNTKTLDLGCGAHPRNPFHADGMFGVDVRDDLGDHVRPADLIVEPIPYDDNSFDYLSAFDFIEHLPRVVYTPKRRNAFIEFMNEAYRVVKPGGYFLSSTPAYPHAVAFRDPTHVNIITDETFPMYFDDKIRWASIYGFKGAFHVVRHEWRGPHIFAVLRKVPVPAEPGQAAAPGSRVSVFLPVYNGARLLAKTLDSLLAQTHADFEVLCIDDCSTDGSHDILQQYAQRDARIRVLRTPGNLGTASRAVNYGLQHMTGDYFVYASQDDLFSSDWLEKMHARAVETGADAVLPDLVLHHPDDPASDRRISGLRGDRGVELSGRDAVLHSLDWTIPGNALWRASLVKFFGFADFGLNADEYTARVLFLHANKVVFSEGTFFYRQDNAEAVTKKITPKSFDYPYTQLRLYQLVNTENFAPEVIQQQAIRTVTLRNQLQQWLEAHGAASFSADDIALARDRLNYVTACMQRDPMFKDVA